MSLPQQILFALTVAVACLAPHLASAWTYTYSMSCTVRSAWRQELVVNFPDGNARGYIAGQGEGVSWSSSDSYHLPPSSLGAVHLYYNAYPRWSTTITTGQSSSHISMISEDWVDYDYNDLVCTVWWNNPSPATCSINVSPNPIIRGNSAYLYWSTTYADQWTYITDIGYVASSGGTYVAPSSSTVYQCYARGEGGDSGWQPVTLGVYQPCSLPWGGSISHGQSVTAYYHQNVGYGQSCSSQTRSCSNGSLSGSYQYASCSAAGPSNCTFNGSTISHGSSVTAYQASTVPYGSSCASQSRSCTNGSLSGSYAYSSCSVQSPASCSLGGVTVAHGSSHTFYSAQTASAGQTCASIAQSRTCSNGSLSGSSSYQYSSCSCAPLYSCSGQNIRYTNSSCVTSTVTTCTSPGYCTAGQSSCQYDGMEYGSFENGEGVMETGELAARPEIVPMGGTTKLYWNVDNAQSCTIEGDNGDSFTGGSSGANGRTTSALTERTVYTLTCSGYPGTSPQTLTGSVTVNIIPIFGEF